jgi:hypothetical protein
VPVPSPLFGSFASYRALGVNLIRAHDQDSHDVDKCLDSISQLDEVVGEAKVGRMVMPLRC